MSRDFAQVLKHLDRTTSTLRLPDIQNENIDPYLQTGFYPLPHKMRQGSQTVSWYHGPLAPKSNTETIDFPAKGSDALLRYYKEDGMFDVSYSAAWELGRLLALQNSHFSTSLYQWKRRYAKIAKQQAQANTHAHLVSATTNVITEPMPDSVKDWLTRLEHLEGIPFNYLVPDEKLLPVESIRFFELDKLWVTSLLDGAFSMGRVTSSDHSLDTKIRENENGMTQPISGFILRSDVVAGWPGMQIDGKGDNDAPLTLIRRVKLSDNVLLCLFEGDLQTLDLHLKPEVLHFGINIVPNGESIQYMKTLRDNNGEEQDTNKIEVPINNDLVLKDITGLMSNIRTEKGKNTDIAWPNEMNKETSANLALQMLEGVELVSFTKKKNKF